MNLHNIPIEKRAEEKCGFYVEGLFWIKDGTRCSRCNEFIAVDDERAIYNYLDGHHTCAGFALGNRTGNQTYFCEHDCSHDTAHYFIDTRPEDEIDYTCDSCAVGSCPTYPS